MARARNIKPGFYKNEDLAECSVWARYIFPGLWMLADREGRLEDRPKRIKGELLPFDLQDVEPLLTELEAGGFLVRYQNSDGSFIQISKFSVHQSPHYSEKPSVIKAPLLQETRTHDEVKKPGEPQEHSEKTTPIKRGSQPPDSLIPDSLIPESLKEQRRSRGSRLPPDWKPSELLKAFAAKERPDLDLATVTATFCDYWSAVPGSKGLKLDWEATFRVWVRGEKAVTKPKEIDFEAFAKRIEEEDRKNAGV